jgi:hypothetical protein
VTHELASKAFHAMALCGALDGRDQLIAQREGGRLYRRNATASEYSSFRWTARSF